MLVDDGTHGPATAGLRRLHLVAMAKRWAASGEPFPPGRLARHFRCSCYEEGQIREVLGLEPMPPCLIREWEVGICDRNEWLDRLHERLQEGLRKARR